MHARQQRKWQPLRYGLHIKGALLPAQQRKGCGLGAGTYSSVRLGRLYQNARGNCASAAIAQSRCLHAARPVSPHCVSTPPATWQMERELSGEPTTGEPTSQPRVARHARLSSGAG